MINWKTFDWTTIDWTTFNWKTSNWVISTIFRLHCYISVFPSYREPIFRSMVSVCFTPKYYKLHENQVEIVIYNSIYNPSIGIWRNCWNLEIYKIYLLFHIKEKKCDTLVDRWGEVTAAGWYTCWERWLFLMDFQWKFVSINQMKHLDKSLQTLAIVNCTHTRCCLDSRIFSSTLVSEQFNISILTSILGV